MKHRSTTITLEISIPDWNREAFTDMLVAGENIVPWTNRALLIDEPFFYSHETDVENALTERFTPEWRKRKYAYACREAELLSEELPDEEFDASAIFKRMVRRELRQVRVSANIEIARCWVNLLKRRPQYADRCPWRFFQYDLIWQTLRDEELLRAINCTPLQLAEKMDLNAMSAGDWNEVLKIVPELAARRPSNL